MEIQLMSNPLPGVRLILNEEQPGGPPKEEEGAILAFRGGGNEVLFGSLSDEKRRPLAWIPVEQFSVDPDAIEPVELVDEPPPGGEPGDEPEPAGVPPEGLAEEPAPGMSPFGRQRPGRGR